MDWTRVSLAVDGEAAEAVAEALRPFAHGGVCLEQTAADLSPDSADPALPDQVTVSVYLSQANDTPEKRRRIEEIIWHLGQLYPIPAPAFGTVREEDWANTWKQHYAPFRVGRRMVICPAWQRVDMQPGDLLIFVDPGMAFGTGLHPSTRMCLEAVEEHVRPGMRVLDLGTGSGILAIAAARLGASSIRALDSDPVAVVSARLNGEINRVVDLIQLSQGSLCDLGPSEEWDVVLVNILAPVILQLLEEGLALRVRPGGLLVLSGIIEAQARSVKAAMEEWHLPLVQRRQVSDWVTLIGRRPITQ